MITSSLALNSSSQAKKKRAMRTKAMLATAVISLAGLTFIPPQPAAASCYGTGYSRRCDGRGGPNATYSSRGANGRTTYYRSGNPYKTHTYKTYYR
ncbi:hypothetical protein [Prochlorococcus sp. MIT 0601]|uniref:hypothetical protein n=1 Tax=Prochlorococcus sp. MIT 0601 TaxID=1499498 RepID=UPI001267C37F|nr:hypothetical protein [Prochlorococcus sp. MIT 0601]